MSQHDLSGSVNVVSKSSDLTIVYMAFVRTVHDNKPVKVILLSDTKIHL